MTNPPTTYLFFREARSVQIISNLLGLIKRGYIADPSTVKYVILIHKPETMFGIVSIKFTR